MPLIAQIPVYERQPGTPSDNMAGSLASDYGEAETAPLVALPRNKRNAALAGGFKPLGLGLLIDRENTASLDFTMKPHHGGPAEATVEISRPVYGKLNGLDDLGGLAFVNNPYLAILIPGQKRLIITGEGKGDLNGTILKLPPSLIQQIFNADVVRVITKLENGSNFVMTFDTKAFHEKVWYSYALNPLQQESIDAPLWDAPLKIRIGETSRVVMSGLESKDHTTQWSCWIVDGNLRYKACGRHEIGEYQFYDDRLFAEAGECDLGELACTAMLNRLLMTFDFHRTYKDIEDALNRNPYKLTKVRKGDESFLFGFNHGDVQWCRIDFKLAPAGAYCLSER